MKYTRFTKENYINMRKKSKIYLDKFFRIFTEIVCLICPMSTILY